LFVTFGETALDIITRFGNCPHIPVANKFDKRRLI